MSDNVILTPSLRLRLEAVVRRVRRFRVVRGLSFVALTLVLSAAAAMLGDYFLTLPAVLRLMLFGGWLILGMTTILAGLVVPLRRRLETADLAAAVEHKYPELAERLTTTVELASVNDEFHGSRALIALLVSDTAERTSGLDFLAAVSARSATVMGFVALAVFILALSPAMVWTREYTNLGQRFFLAWNGVEWSTSKKTVPYDLEVTTQNILTARGRLVTFSARLVRLNDGVPLPKSSTLVLLDGDGHETRIPMAADWQDTFKLEHKVTQDGRYRIEAGDAVSPTYTIQAILPVELAEDSPVVNISAPAYALATILDQQLTGLLDLSALKHSEIKFEFRFTRPAVTAFVEWTALEIKPAKDGSKPELRTTMLPVVFAEDRRSATLTLPAVVSGAYRVVLEAEQGIRTELDAKTLTVRVDQPPQVVRFAGKEELGSILPYDRVPLEITVGDDVGVARADLEYRINNDEVRTEALTLDGANRQQATVKLAWQLATKVQEGDEVTYRIRIQDNLPTEFGGPQMAYYPPDRWLKLKVAKNVTPLREQEIVAQRDAIDKRLDAIRAELLKEQHGIYKLDQESRAAPSLAPEQTDALQQLEKENRTTGNALSELARETEGTPALESLASRLQGVADRELHQSETALQNAANRKTEQARRDNEFQTAEKALASALQKLDELKSANAKLAQGRLDQQKVQTLADREKHLAERAAELASKDSVRDPQFKEALEQVQREQAEVASELQRLSEQSEMLRKILEEARAEEALKLSEQAKEIAEAQRELSKAMRETNERRNNTEEQGNKENPLGELAKQQDELARQAAELAKNVHRDQGEKAPTTQEAHKAQQAALQAANKMKAGATPAAQQAGKESAAALRQLAQDLAQTPRGKGDPNPADLLQQARQLAQKQEELNRKLDPLAQDTDAQRAQQQARQLELEQQAGQLAKDLNKLGQQMDRMPQSQNAAKQAQDSAQEAQKQMRQANEQQKQGNPSAAQQAQQSAAQALERAGQQARQASNKPLGEPKPGTPQEGGKPGQAVRLAQDQMGQAQDKLSQGQPQSAQTAMQQAARSLQQAAQQMASQPQGQPSLPGQPTEMTRPGEIGAASTGRPDPTMFGPDAQKYAGKTWGELPGELQTKIVQDMKAKYGDDYARMIKLYFEQIADTKK